MELLNDTFLLLNASEAIVKTIQIYVGPFLLLFIGLMSLKFVKDQQFMALISFIVIAIVVCIVFYAPGVLKTIATTFTGETGISTGTTTPTGP